jgi:hypothetical protein
MLKMKTHNHAQIIRSISIAAAVGLVALNAHGSIVGVAGGDAAPPATLGPFTMTPFAPDLRPEFDPVNSVPSPLGGDVTFSPDLVHLVVGSSWASWSHGFLGDVYWTDGGLSASLTLPPNTGAFFLYAQPNQAQSFDITVETQDGTPVTQTVDGNGGASLFGFYTTEGSLISSITISSSEEFAIGEFGIALARGAGVPDTVPWAPGIASLAFLGFALLQRRSAT